MGTFCWLGEFAGGGGGGVTFYNFCELKDTHPNTIDNWLAAMDIY